MSYFSPQNLLSQASRVRCITRFKKVREIYLAPKAPEKKAAVLIPLCIVNDKVSLLYTLRSAHLNKHRGQVSFPGGKCDPEDIDIVSTALRETEEELGIPRENIDIWGEGTPSPSGLSKMRIHLIVGHINNFDITRLKPNPEEVEEVFTVPIEALCDPKNAGHTQFIKNIILPIFQYEKRRIWGLTSYNTHTFLSSLLTEEYYRNDFMQQKVEIDYPKIKL